MGEYYISKMLKRVPTAPKVAGPIKAALVIDGAYLMISASLHATHLLPYFQTAEGVISFLTGLKSGIVNAMKKCKKEFLSPHLASKLSGDANIEFISRHILYAVKEKGGLSHSPEKVNKDAWSGFSVHENMHRYKSHTKMCKHCGKTNEISVQAGVDVGVATRLCEVLIENIMASSLGDINDLRADIIILIAGDRDFADIMKLCMKYESNLFLAGFKENTHDALIKECCVSFFHIPDLVGAPPPQAIPHQGYVQQFVVGVEGIKDTGVEQVLVEMLRDAKVVPKRYKSFPDRNNASQRFMLIICYDHEQGEKALKIVKHFHNN